MKILIIYAYAGIGHKKAALAIERALKDYKDITSIIIDVLDYTNPVFKFFYPRIYLFLINRLPCLWGFLYRISDLEIVDRIFAPVRRFIQDIQSKKFIRYVLEEKADVVLCTQFLPAEIVAELKRKGLFKGRLITVVTDFLPHTFWLIKDSDHIIVALDRTKKAFVEHGIEQEKIEVLGIPCNPVFGISKDREIISRRLGLKKDLFNLLIIGGGFGTGPIEKIISTLSSEAVLRDVIQIIVIAGKNKRLYKRLRRKTGDLRVRLAVFGFVHNIDEFMEVSDCIVTKSGGLTVSEALAKKLPMIIIRPIPGQETGNCRILTGYGAALWAHSPRDVRDYVKEFITKPERILGMKTRSSLLAYPNAAKDIAEFVLRWRY